MSSEESFDQLREQILGKLVLETVSAPECSIPEAHSLFSDVANQMCKCSVGALPVTIDGKLVGVISERDLLRGSIEDNSIEDDTTIAGLYTTSPVSITTESTVKDALAIFLNRSFSHLPIVDSSGVPQNILSARDLLFFVASFFSSLEEMGTMLSWTNIVGHTESEALLAGDLGSHMGDRILFHTPLRRIPAGRTLTADVNSPLSEIMQLIYQRRISHVILMSYGTKMVGIITERDLLTKVFGNPDVADLTVQSIMTTGLRTMLNKHLLGHAINNLKVGHYRHTLLVNEDRYPTGMISMLDILKFITDKLFGDLLGK
jgi:CBS domain-containing protein